MSEELKIALDALLVKLIKAGDEYLPKAYAAGKGYAAAKSGFEITASKIDADIVSNSLAFNAGKLGEMLKKMDAEILSLSPSAYPSVDAYMEDVERIFNKYAGRTHAWTYYAEQPFFDGFMQGAGDVWPELARKEGIDKSEMGFFWKTAEDERVCFSAGQLVTTGNGDVPIEKILPGVTVITQNGQHKVIATAKSHYKKLFVAIKTEHKLITATSDHLIFEVCKGWVQAKKLRVGDIVQTVNNEGTKIIGIVYFCLFNSENLKALRNKKTISSVISLGNRRVPVIPIYFEGDTKFWEQEINAVIFKFSLLNIANLKCIKSLANFLFGKRFSLKTAVTSEATKLMIFSSRLFSKVFPATLAGDNNGGAATLFGTKESIIALFRYLKNLATSFAFLIFGINQSTFHTANGITISNRRLNHKIFLTNWACFDDINSGAADFTAFPRTSFASATYQITRKVVSVSTNLADYILSSLRCIVITFVRTIFSRSLSFTTVRAFKLFFTKLTNMLKNTLSPLAILYHKLFGTKNLYVYNLEVENDPTYFVSGLLVHNCSICWGLNGQWFPLDRKNLEITWVSHVNCRCPEYFEFGIKPEE